MKRRNAEWGCLPIAQQISLAFGISINKEVVRRYAVFSAIIILRKPTRDDGAATDTRVHRRQA